jgi:hypothetical protein
MRTHSSRVVRWVGAAVIAMITVGALPAATHAATPVFGARIITQTSAYHQGPAECSTSDTGHNGYANVPTTGAEIEREDGGKSSVTNNSTGAKTQILQQARGKASLTVKNGQISGYHLTGTGSVSAKATTGQTCGAYVTSTVEHDVDFLLERPVWVTIRTTSSKNTSLFVDGSSEDGSLQFGQQTDTVGGATTSTWYLPRGRYSLDAAAVWQLNIKEGQDEVVHAGSGSVHVEFRDAGSAVAPSKGSGRKYVSLGGQVQCRANLALVAVGTVPATFTTSKVRKATFSIDGKVVKKVRHPRSKSSAAVLGVPDHRTSIVKARLVVDPPGSRRTAVVTVTRTYRPCSAG